MSHPPGGAGVDLADRAQAVKGIVGVVDVGLPREPRQVARRVVGVENLPLRLNDIRRMPVDVVALTSGPAPSQKM